MAKNDFEKDLFKLMNKSVFGKTMKNIRKRQDIRLSTDISQGKNLICQSNFNKRTIFSDTDLVTIHMDKT